MRFVGEDNLDIFKITNIMEKMRVSSMINGEKITKQNFALLTVNAARQILKGYVKNQKKIDEIVECVEPDTISGFELKDILNEVFDAEGIKKAII